MRCLLVGNYGVRNIGDEALREYFIAAFPDVYWTVLGVDVPRLPFGFRSFFTSWLRTISAIRRSDAVVFGGGSLFTDSESVFACVLWWWHGFVARILGKPLFLAFQGVGPFRTSFAQLLARSTFEKALFVSVRDEASLKRIERWNLRSKPILTFDPVFALFSTKKPTKQQKRILAVIPRANSDDAFFVAVSSLLLKPFDEVRILLMQPDSCEQRIAARIQAMTTVPSVTISVTSVDQLLTEVAGVGEVISQRYHGALAARAMGIDASVIPQSAGDKLDELRKLPKNSEERSRLLGFVEEGKKSLLKALAVVG